MAKLTENPLSDAARKRLVTKYQRPGIVDAHILQSGCVRCRSRFFVDISIHEGRSVRRDCAQCGKFRKFVVWYGQLI